MVKAVGPLNAFVPIVDGQGRPTVEFQTKWREQAQVNSDIPALSTAAQVSAVLDKIGSTSGQILVRGSEEWGALSSPGGTTKYLRADGSYAAPPDTTYDVVTDSAAGLVPELPSDETKYLNGAGAWAVPAGGGGGDETGIFTAAIGTSSYSVSSATIANLFTPSTAFGVSVIQAYFAFDAAGVYKLGIAEVNPATKELTEAPTYAGTVTKAGTMFVIGEFATPALVAAGHTYAMLLVRTDSTTTVSQDMRYSSSTPSVGYGVTLPTSGTAHSADSIAPAMGTTLNSEGGGVWSFSFLQVFPGGQVEGGATVDVGTTTTLAPGSPATVSNSGTTTDAVFDFGIPAGANGDPGPGVAAGGAAGQTLAKASATNYDTEWVTPPAHRELLTADRAYYVNGTTGADSNDGLSSSAPFATIQKAIDAVGALDLGIYDATINVADGTYDEALTLTPLVGAGSCSIIGNQATPSNVLLAPTATMNANQAVIASGAGLAGATWKLRGMKVLKPTARGIAAIAGVIYASDFLFGDCAYAISADMLGAIRFDGDWGMGGTYSIGILCTYGGIVVSVNNTITIAAGTTFGSAANLGFASALRASSITLVNNTFVGTATGRRYYTQGNSFIDVNGAGGTALPGDSAGTEVAGGTYA